MSKNGTENEENRSYATEVTMAAPVQEGFGQTSGINVTEVTMVSPEETGTQIEKTKVIEYSADNYAADGDNLQPGDHLDRYTVVRKLGQGGMGSVYLVRHETLGVFRAAKVLSGALYRRGGEFVKRFLQEARLACSISNPNIVNVLDVGDNASRSLCYIIMEYVDGGTIRDVLKSTPRLGEIHSLLVAEAVAEALRAAYQQKIVHRDVKPDNIMLTRHGEIKLADLGIAKNSDENVQLTKSHIMMGTPAYLAPEQAQDARSVDVRADIYSLGATLYEMLTGQIPYPGKSTYDILAKLVSSPVPDPRDIVSDISPQTARLVMKMLAKQPKQRQQTPDALLKEIRSMNIIPSELDSQESIRDLLEKSGAGKYTATSSTATMRNPVSLWLMRHCLFPISTVLRKVPGFSFFVVHPALFLVSFFCILLIAFSVPFLLNRNAASRLPETPVPSVRQAAPAASVPEISGKKLPEKKISSVKPKKPEVKKIPEKTAKKPEPVKKPLSVSPRVSEQKKAQVKPLKQPEKPIPVVKKTVPAAVKPVVPVPAEKKEIVPVQKKIPVFAEISPAGAKVELHDGENRRMEMQLAPLNGKIKFQLPSGKYRLLVFSAGFKPEERVFTVSGDQESVRVVIDLAQDLCRCVIHIYGGEKLLAFLKREKPEIKVDRGTWTRVSSFPSVLKLARAAHTLELRGKGIYPISQTVKISPDQKEHSLEFYPSSKEARLELKTAIRKNVKINLAGLWEPFRENISLLPFRRYTLQWKVEGEPEETVQIPELDPGSVFRLELKRSRSETHPADPLLKEALTLIKDGSYKDAVEKLNEADKKGHPEAAYLLGELAEQGKGRWFSSDSDAAAYYKKAAGEPFRNGKAQMKLGIFYENGRGGLPKDIKTALSWYRKAAEKRIPEAVFRVGMAYKNGEDNEPVDYAKMVECFKIAAEAGHAEAQFNLGFSYENGIGVPINVNLARYWYGKAAEQGNENARRLGKILEGLK